MQKIFFPSSRPIFVNEEAVIKKLRKIALQLSKENRNTEAIYLFGSYLKGTAGLHSDADVLVVLKEDRRRPIDRLDEFILAFLEAPIPVDVLAATMAEVDLALRDGNRFFLDAVKGLRLA